MTADDRTEEPAARLWALEEDVDEARRRLVEEHGSGERRFIDDGALDEGLPVDNAIVPPG